MSKNKCLERNVNLRTVWFMIHFVIYSSADSREIFFLCRSHFVVVVVFLIFTCPIAQLCLEKVRSAFKKHLSKKKKRY